MARKKREFTTFNLSFLDIMSCGFGAVVLVFLIMNHAIETEQQEAHQDLRSEVDLVELDVADGQAGLVQLRNTLSDVDREIVEARGRADRILEEQDKYRALLKELEQEETASNPDVEKLRADVQSLEAQVETLKQSAADASGTSARTVTGQGRGVYPSGLRLVGRNIAILFDVSTSMLAADIVNIKLMQAQLAAYPPGTRAGDRVLASSSKWRQALRTIDWLTSQLPIVASYQVITFSGEAEFAVEDTAGKWLEVADQASLDKLDSALRKITPGGGTSLSKAFQLAATLQPVPDNIVLITDSLPTQGDGAQFDRPVTPKQRVDLFNAAVSKLPPGIPVNTFLFPMEGDPLAPSLFWNLANVSNGSFIVPSGGWP
ncbi:MAG: VWA domain-containing protein [Halioglobus sp.]